MANNKTGTSNNTLDYYSKNWEKIANCYTLDSNNIPIDPSWYRREIYKKILEISKPKSVLDIGCGGGWTVLDALELEINVKGIEPIKELKEHGNNLLKKNGYNPDLITQNDLSILYDLPSNSIDCIAFLSVLPHVPKSEWKNIHKNIARILKANGKFIAVYRNKLFDLFTFNSITLEFYDKDLWQADIFGKFKDNNINQLKTLVTNPNVPGPYFTVAKDKSFGMLQRVKSNPLTIEKYLSSFCISLENIHYYHFHCVPPLISQHIENFKEINDKMELNMANDWRGNFMAAMFIVEATKK